MQHSPCAHNFHFIVSEFRIQLGGCRVTVLSTSLLQLFNTNTTGPAYPHELQFRMWVLLLFFFVRISFVNLSSVTAEHKTTPLTCLGMETKEVFDHGVCLTDTPATSAMTLNSTLQLQKGSWLLKAAQATRSK